MMAMPVRPKIYHITHVDNLMFIRLYFAEQGI